MEVSFSSLGMPSNLIVDCPINLYLVGDLKFYAQMSGREGMSSYWCMWCQLHPSEWRTFQKNSSAVPEEEKKMWTGELHKEVLEKIINGELKEPRKKKGIIDQPVWEFIQPANFIFPHLHFEIGVVNMVLENLCSFIEEQVEMILLEEKVARNNIIISEVSLKEAKERLENWHAT